MLDALFSALTVAISQSYAVALAASFAWGVLSVLLSPCHLSGIPLVIGYISSHGRIQVKRTLFLSFLFASGSLLTIAIIGVITASMGRMLGDTGEWGNYVIAAVFMVMGLYLFDLLPLRWKSITFSDEQRGGLWGAFVLGLFFGIGLGPCTFAYLAPVLGVVFTLAAESWLKAFVLIAVFGVGHAAVIAVAGSMTNLVQRYLDWAGKSLVMLSLKRAVGVLLLLVGCWFLYTAIVPR